MIEAPDTLAVLRRTLSIVQDRGWAATLSLDSTGPLNLRNAIATACTDLTGIESSKAWFTSYLAVVHHLWESLGHTIADWEFTVKSPSEVEAMLAEVISRLESEVVS